MRQSTLINRLPRQALTAALLALPGLGGADSGVGVDTWRANALDPGAGTSSQVRDARGTSWLRPDQHRSPSGNLYIFPARTPDESSAGDWLYFGRLQLGYFATSGDDDNAQWNRYVDWGSQLVLGLFELALTRPSDGSYAELRASRISSDDEYYQAVFGRAGSYRVQAFMRDVPNVLSSNAKPIWNGVGGNRLTLPDSLSPGNSSVAQVTAVSAATPERTLQVTRSKQGLGFNLYLNPQWSAYAAISDEQRKGARAFGGPFFFNYMFENNAGVLETAKPVDDSTINLNGGMRFAGKLWRMDVGYTGSFYRDRYTSFSYESPYSLYPVLPNATSAPIFQGQFAMEPDNDYHRLQATATRRLPLNGELSLTAAGGRMSQDDRLIAPINCQGVFGIDLDGSGQVGPGNPFLYSCANWNTPAALSRTSADMSIDTTLFNARVVLQPGSAFTIRGGLKFNREDYRNTYLAFNPLTGQYGYVSENGSRGSIVPGGVGIWDPVTSPSAITRVRSLPLDMQTIESNVGGDWRLSERNTLGITYNYSRYEPTHRERQQVDNSSVKLTWVNRALDWLTVRANYTYLRQDGDRYNYNPYDFTYSISLPGFVVPEGGVPAHTVEALRKYDIASRDENKFDLMATLMPRDDMSLSASVRGDWNDYDAEIGRQKYDTLGFSLQWEWQPSPSTSANVYYGYDRSSLRMANVNDQDIGSDPTLGGAAYPNAGRWWADDKQRNHNAGVSFDHRFGRTRLDANWNLLQARGLTSYRFASPSALAYFSDGIGISADAFPPMRYRVNSLTIGMTVPIAERCSLRLFDYYERARIDDWHYLGLDTARVHDHRIYTDGGPESYSANLIGLLLNISL